MKTHLRKPAVLVVVILVTSGFAVAKNAPDEEIRNAVEMQARAAELAQKEAEIAAEIARKQAEAAQRQAEIAIVARDKAVPTPPVPPTPPAAPEHPYLEALPRVQITSSRNYSPWRSGRSGSTGAVLVVPAAEIKTEDILTITEDMSVMSRIFERNLELARIGTASGDSLIYAQYPFGSLLGRGGSRIQSIYLQGFGALFSTTVDFPLVPGPQAQQEEQTQEDEDVDEVWERTRNEMYQPEGARRRTTRATGKPKEEYDAEKVESFKTTLIKSLKHAANIRSLKADELVVITVTGSGDSATLVGEATSAKTKILVVGSDGETRVIEEMSPGGEEAFFPAVLVIRAKKSDIDAFAEGTLDLEQFRQRVQVLTCPYLGAVAGGGAFHYKYTGVTLPSSGPQTNR